MITNYDHPLFSRGVKEEDTLNKLFDGLTQLGSSYRTCSVCGERTSDTLFRVFGLFPQLKFKDCFQLFNTASLSLSLSFFLLCLHKVIYRTFRLSLMYTC